MFLLRDEIDEFTDKTGAYFAGPPMFVPPVDEHMRGMPPQTTTVLAGVSGVGKSAYALHVAAALTQEMPDDHVVLYALNEMGPQLFVDRLVSWITKIPGRHIITGDYTNAARYVPHFAGYNRETIGEQEAQAVVAQAYDELRTWNLAVAHSASMSTFDIENWLGALHGDGYTVPLVVIDYVGRLTDQPMQDSMSGTQDFISSRLVSIAQEHNTHVLGIKDFNRVGETASGTPPLHALRGSTRIRYDADYIIFLSSDTLSNAAEAGSRVTHTNFNVTISLMKSRNAGVVGQVGSSTFYAEAGFFDFEQDYRHLDSEYEEWRQTLSDEDDDDFLHGESADFRGSGSERVLTSVQPPVQETKRLWPNEHPGPGN